MTKTSIKKAVILAAGLGTRFLPMTKAIPKAMLPILDKPVLQYLVEEAQSSGIKEIILVIGHGQQIIKDHFGQKGFTYVEQKEPKGDGHALLCAQKAIGNEPFAVLFGDDIVDAREPALHQLFKVYEETGTPVLAIQPIPKDQIQNYGIIKPGKKEGQKIQVKGLVEKPKPKDAPSNLGIIGKFICTPEILSYLEKSHSSLGDEELRLIDGFRACLADGKSLYALEIQGTRFDTGNRAGLLQANLAFALKDPELAKILRRE